MIASSLSFAVVIYLVQYTSNMDTFQRIPKVEKLYQHDENNYIRINNINLEASMEIMVQKSAVKQTFWIVKQSKSYCILSIQRVEKYVQHYTIK